MNFLTNGMVKTAIARAGSCRTAIGEDFTAKTARVGLAVVAQWQLICPCQRIGAHTVLGNYVPGH